MTWQTTLREKVSLTGIGLHSGGPISLVLLPAPANHGIVFERSDVAGNPEIRPCLAHLVDTTQATSLGTMHRGQRVVIATVEHLLATFHGLGVDNVRVLVSGPELPALDGSAQPFVRSILGAGIETQRHKRRHMVMRREVKVVREGKEARLAPAAQLSIECSIDFDHPLIAPAPLKITVDSERFVRELAPARTFVLLREVEALKARGLAKGGSLDNTIVIDNYQILNPDGLRFTDEFVRHKALDALGDISLLGLPIIGKLSLHRSGHGLNTELVRQVLSDPRNFEIVVPQESSGSSEAAFSTRQADLFSAAKGVA